MSLFTMVMVSIGAFAGGFVNGLAGFGTGLFALGWWLAAILVNDAVLLVIIMSISSGVQGLLIVRHRPCPSRDGCYRLLGKICKTGSGACGTRYWLVRNDKGIER